MRAKLANSIYKVISFKILSINACSIYLNHNIVVVNMKYNTCDLFTWMSMVIHREQIELCVSLGQSKYESIFGLKFSHVANDINYFSVRKNT